MTEAAHLRHVQQDGRGEAAQPAPEQVVAPLSLRRAPAHGDRDHEDEDQLPGALHHVHPVEVEAAVREPAGRREARKRRARGGGGAVWLWPSSSVGEEMTQAAHPGALAFTKGKCQSVLGSHSRIKAP